MQVYFSLSLYLNNLKRSWTLLSWSCKSERIPQFKHPCCICLDTGSRLVDGLFRSTRRNVTHVNEFRHWPISVEDCPIHRETSNFSVYFRNLLFENDRTVSLERDSPPFAC